ncbi:hypothetical protein MXB_3737, partial [Myxobolus squamalis]
LFASSILWYLLIHKATNKDPVIDHLVYLESKNTQKKLYSETESNFFEMHINLPYQKYSSRILAHLFTYQIPIFSKLLSRIYYQIFKINLNLCKITDISKYNSIFELFTRQPNRSALPGISHDLMVSPCEGKVVSMGKVDLNEFENPLLDIKGKDCDLISFLGINSSTLSEKALSKRLFYIVIYLSPSNLHRFYAPLNFSELQIIQIFGFGKTLLSTPYIKPINNVLCLNHRVIISGTTMFGNFYYVPVGAFNVNTIFLSNNNKTYINSYEFLSYTKEKQLHDIKKGEEMGYFAFGSTIALIFEGEQNFEF